VHNSCFLLSYKLDPWNGNEYKNVYSFKLAIHPDIRKGNAVHPLEIFLESLTIICEVESDQVNGLKGYLNTCVIVSKPYLT